MKKTTYMMAIMFLMVSVLRPSQIIAGDSSGTIDNERIIDVESLQVILEKSTNEIENRAKKTQLLKSVSANNGVLPFFSMSDFSL